MASKDILTSTKFVYVPSKKAIIPFEIRLLPNCDQTPSKKQGWFKDTHEKEVLQLMRSAVDNAFTVRYQQVQEKQKCRYSKSDVICGKKVKIAYHHVLQENDETKPCKALKRKPEQRTMGADEHTDEIFCSSYPIIPLKMVVCVCEMNKENVATQNDLPSSETRSETDRIDGSSPEVETRREINDKRKKLTMKKPVNGTLSQEKKEIVTNTRLNELSLDELKKIFVGTREYLRGIFKGTVPCVRHDNFKKGGKARSDLDHHVPVTSFRSEQIDFVIDLLKHMMGEPKIKFLDYNLRVLLPEMLVKIVMETFKIDYDEAELLLHNNNNNYLKDL